jgi:hypothetical protein
MNQSLLDRAPITFSVTKGAGFLSLTTNEVPIQTSISTQTDSAGLAGMRWFLASPFDSTNEVTATVQTGLFSTNVVFTSFTGDIDSDKDGMADAWEIRYFGSLSVTAEQDFDQDGVDNLREFRGRSDPTDFYNGILPSLRIVSGDFQHGPTNFFLSLPYVVQVLQTNQLPYINAPIEFSLLTGSGLVSPSPSLINASSNLTLRSGSDGMIRLYHFLSSPVGTTNQVAAVARTGKESTGVILHSTTVDSDIDEDGLGDNWELQNFGNMNRLTDDDLDEDGVNEYFEYLGGTSPSDFYNGQAPTMIVTGGNNQSGPTNAFLLLPLKIEVRNSNGVRWGGAPVVFSVVQGSGLLRDESQGVESALALQVRANPYGRAQIKFSPSSVPGTVNRIRAVAGSGVQTQEVIFLETSTEDDQDHDGLPDAWELRYFGNLLQVPGGDFDQDGRTNLQESNAGADPRIHDTDTDSDGIRDVYETLIGSDPLQGFSLSFPQFLSYERHRP